MDIFKVQLGAKARDVVTGYTGIVVARTEWLYGCIRYVLQSQDMKDGKPVDVHVVDEPGVEVLVPSLITGVTPASEAAAADARGGQRKDPPRGQTVT